MTVDGLPILDWAGPFRNATIATGYSMLGMTLSPARGRGDGRDDRRPAGDRTLFEPFRIDRFPRWIVRRSAASLTGDPANLRLRLPAGRGRGRRRR